MKKIFTLVAAALFAANVMADDTTTVVGAEDNTALFWTAFSDSYTIPAENTLHLEFTNYSSKENNWNNWIVVVTNDAERNGDGYVEYVVLRADNWGWKGAQNTTDNSWYTSLSSNYNWETFKDDMDGAKVVLDVARSGSVVTINADATNTSGTTYNENFVINIGESTANIRAFLTTEKGHLVIDNTKTNIATGITNVEAVKTSSKAYNLAGQQVGDGFKGIKIANGKKFVVK